MKTLHLKVKMHCPSCALSIEKQLKKIKVQSRINPVFQTVDCTYDQNEITPQDIIKAVKKTGYPIYEYQD